MKHYITKGYINGIIAAISYGTNPLFALPMYTNGLGVNSVLFYRYFFAVLIYGLWLKLYKKRDFKLTIKEYTILFILGIIFALSSLFLFDAFNYLESGLACTILFSYPLIVALISRIIFKERQPKTIWIALFMVIAGIILLYGGNPKGNLSSRGIILVLLSALSYAIYMVGVKEIKLIKHIKPDILAFYTMLFGLSIFMCNLKFCLELQPINNLFVFGCAILLALFPTIISLETISIAIKIIGAVKTSIIGALEPLTAIAFGLMLFGETMTYKIFCGILLILLGVIVVIVHKKK
ncbi:EamA family transporter [bacterium]|nr:EamA family transporter [bacterium]